MAEGARVHRLGKLPSFNPEEGPDASLVLSWSGDELTYIEKSIAGITYRKTFTWTGGYPTSITDWVKQ